MKWWLWPYITSWLKSISYTILWVIFNFNFSEIINSFYWIQLYPNDNQILEDFKTELTEAKTFAKKINAIVSAEKQLDDQLAAEEEKRRQFATNQKLGLISALFKVGDWQSAKTLIDRLPEYYAVSFDIIAKQLCDLIHVSIDKFYRQ